MSKYNRYNSTIVTRIPSLRRLAKLTTQDMADLFNYSKTSYSNKERKGSFTMKEAKIIAEHFTKKLGREITVNDLY